MWKLILCWTNSEHKGKQQTEFLSGEKKKKKKPDICNAMLFQIKKIKVKNHFASPQRYSNRHTELYFHKP